jgi:hypothetical protein
MWLRIPHGLEHAVREAQRDQVLHRLPPEEVVDAEDALLGEDAVHELVEAPGAREVGAERLLEHEAGTIGEAGGPQRGHELGERAGRDREVVQPPRVPSELRLGRRDGLLERARVIGAEGGEGQPLGEQPPLLPRGVVGERPARLFPEVVVGTRPSRGPDDPEVLGHQARAVEVVEAGQELPPGQVAGGAVQDDRVVPGDLRAV